MRHLITPCSWQEHLVMIQKSRLSPWAFSIPPPERLLYRAEGIDNITPLPSFSRLVLAGSALRIAQHHPTFLSSTPVGTRPGHAERVGNVAAKLIPWAGRRLVSLAAKPNPVHWGGNKLSPRHTSAYLLGRGGLTAQHHERAARQNPKCPRCV